MKRLPAALLLLLLVSCTGTGARKDAVVVATSEHKPLQIPAIPSYLTVPADRGEWLAQHFWDNYDYADTTQIASPATTEQALAEFIELLKYAPAETASEAIRKNLSDARRSGRPMLDFFAGLYDKYLYDPNSPARNEDLYIAVLEYLVNNSGLPDIEKARPRYRLEMAMKNRPGTPAADFAYVTISGEKGTMRRIAAPMLLIYFHNPGCGGCKEIMASVASSPAVSQAIASGKLKVLAMYVDGDLATWRERFADIPAGWINAADPAGTLRDGNVYDLRAIPNIYLLDRDKRVILKDAPFEAVEQYLEQQ